MSRVIGIYVCPRGVFGVECRRKSSGVEILQSFDAHGRVESPVDAVRQIERALSQHGIKRAELAVAVRGFGAVHHVLSFPPATDDVLDVLVAREVRRLEPELHNPGTGWTRLTGDAHPVNEPGQQTDVVTAALPGDFVTAFADEIVAAGHTLLHLTVLNTSMHRLAEEFLPDNEPAALVAHLPDGPFIGYSVDGGIRLAVEPPVRDDEALPDIAALADEAELGALFVRQQFRGAQVTQACVIASDDSYAEVEAAIGVRLTVPVTRLPLTGLSAGAVAAFGAVLDARAPHPVSIAGRSVERRAKQAASRMQLAAIAIGAAAAIVGVWAMSQAFKARTAAAELRDAERRIIAATSDLAPARETADRRRTVRDAVAAVQQAGEERAALQRSLASIANSVPASISLDSISLEQRESRWHATLGGAVAGQTSGLAVQSLGGFYRDLGRLAPVESIALKQLTYADTTGRSLVRFEIGFGVRTRPRN